MSKTSNCTPHTSVVWEDTLASNLQVLHAMSSRAQATDIRREVLRLNETVRRLAHQHLSPLEPPASFELTLRALQDVNNQEG